MTIGTSITAFLIGATTAYYAIAAVRMLRDNGHSATRLHKVLGLIFAYWVISNGKDIVLTFPEMYGQKTLDAIAMWDGWSAITYAMFLFELTMPGWNSPKRTAALAVPFALFTAVYVLFPSHGLVTVYLWFLGIFGIAVLTIGFVKARQYTEYIRSNYSNIDEIDISWLGYVYLIAFFSQLLWLVASVVSDAAFDCLYYVAALAMWHLVYAHCRNLRQVSPKSTFDSSEAAMSRDGTTDAVHCFSGDVDGIMAEEKLYLDPFLSLDDLARHLKTNRTYLSNYFSTVRHTTFYDYVNAMRIEKESVPLVASHPEYTLEYIARLSGFKSISTFRRAFRKFTGHNPGHFRSHSAAPAG